MTTVLTSETPTATLGRAFTGARVPTSPAAGRLRAASLGVLKEHLLRHPGRVFNQADVNCCVSCALASGMEILNPGWPNLAALFHYWVARFEAHVSDTQGSLFIDGALDVAGSFGVCRFEDHRAEFTREGAAERPAPAAYTDGLLHRLGRRGRFPAYDEIVGRSRYNKIRSFIREGRPVLLGLTMPRSYPDCTGTRSCQNGFLDSGWRWMDPRVPGDNVYRHCVLVTGYNDAKSALRVLDSQGPTAFDNGSWWIGGSVVDSNVVEEAFALPL